MSADEQARLFDPERYSPMRIDTILRLPGGTTQAFWVASILGNWLRLDGSTKDLRGGKDASGTLVNKRKRGVILKVLDIDLRRWQQLVKDWERRNVAHRCGSSTVFLFAHCLLDVCPACKTWVEVTEMAPAPKKRRGAGFGAKAFAKSEETFRITRTNLSHVGVQTVRFSGTSTTHRTNRANQGIEKGYAAPAKDSVPGNAIDARSSESKQGSSKCFEVYPELRALEMAKLDDERRKKANS